MIKISGKVVGKYDKNVTSKDGKSFDIKYAQIQETFKNGKSILYDVKLSKDMEIKLGDVVDLPLIISTYSPKDSEKVYLSYSVYNAK